MRNRPFSRKRLSSFLPLLLLALAVLLSACRGGPEEKHETAEAIPVEVAFAIRGDLERTLSFSGTVEPWREASLGAQISGKIEKIFVEVGEEVQAGKPLVQMTGEQLTSAKAQLTSTEKDWKRMRSLLKKGTITQQAFDKIDASYEAARANYELVLESTRIKAPFSGTITAKYLEEGEVFTLFGGAAGSPAILEIMQLDPVKVIVRTPEREIPHIKPGLRATVGVDGYPNKTFKGKVYLVEPAADEKTHTVAVRIMIPNSNRRLKPGMFADVNLFLGTALTLLVPRDALVREVGTGKYHLFVVEGDTARRREVALGQEHGEMVAIESGLDSGELVITTGRTLVNEGTPVSITKGEDEE
ncbi:MAG: efflux RND transporter periplasmic adaptor subunit [Candidatus Zixiibacteriota bacterium]